MEKKKDTIEVDKSKLDKVLDRMKELEDKNQELSDKLEATADVGRMQRYEDKNKGKILPRAKITVYNGKIVTSWDNMPENKVENVAGKWITRQTVRYNLEDGTKKDLLFEETINVPRKDVHIEAEKITNDLDPDGNKIVLLDVITEEGKKLTIDRRFIN